MISRFLALSAGALALSGAVALPVFAASVTTSAASTASNPVTNLGATVSGSTSGSSNSNSTSVGVSTSGSMGSTSTSGSASVSGTANSNAGTASANTTGMTSGTLDLNGTDSSVVNFTSNGTTVSDPTAVSSNDQLNTYAESTLHSDSNIQNVQLSDSNVSMSYNESGHLFGFIPVSINATAKVDPSGTVTISYPWYHFLVSTNDAKVKADVQARVSQMLSSTASGSMNGTMRGTGMADASMGSMNANGQFSAQTQAEVMAALHDAFKADASGTATVSGSASAATQ